MRDSHLGARVEFGSGSRGVRDAVALRRRHLRGNGNIFQDFDGSWWSSGFHNTNEYVKRGPQHSRMFIYPLFIGWENGVLVIEALAVRENRARIEQEGALWQSTRR